MRFLRTNTAVRVTIGPAVDKADGFTTLDSLTVANLTGLITVDADDNDAVTVQTHFHPAASGSSNDMVSCGYGGMWDLELTQTQANVLGRMRLTIYDAAQILPIWEDFTVLAANVYDSLFGGHGVTADLLDVNASQVAGTAQSAGDIYSVIANITAAIADVPTAVENADAFDTNSDWADGNRLDLLLDDALAHLGEVITTAEAPGVVSAALLDALNAFAATHSTIGSSVNQTVIGSLFGSSTAPGEHVPISVLDLFTTVRSVLRDDNANSYTSDLMTNYYNRAVSECWNLMVRLGADVVQGHGSIVTTGTDQDYMLPSDFRAFVVDKFVPRSPRIPAASGIYTWGKPLKQVSLRDPRMSVSSTTPASPNYFALYISGNYQNIHFSSLPPAGEVYDYSYYPEPQKVRVENIGSTATPWLGLLDMLLARILEEFCREGLEFITTKRDVWRARAEQDIVELLGLRFLSEIETTPSMWKDFRQ